MRVLVILLFIASTAQAMPIILLPNKAPCRVWMMPPSVIDRAARDSLVLLIKPLLLEPKLALAAELTVQLLGNPATRVAIVEKQTLPFVISIGPNGQANLSLSVKMAEKFVELTDVARSDFSLVRVDSEIPKELAVAYVEQLAQASFAFEAKSTGNEPNLWDTTARIQEWSALFQRKPAPNEETLAKLLWERVSRAHEDGDTRWIAKNFNSIESVSPVPIDQAPLWRQVQIQQGAYRDLFIELGRLAANPTLHKQQYLETYYDLARALDGGSSLIIRATRIP